MVSYRGVMFDQRTSIDNAIVANPRAGIDDGTVHNDRARANDCVSRHMSGRRDDDRKFKSKLDAVLKKANAVIRRPDMANCNECVVIFLDQLRQVIICGENRITEVLGKHFYGPADQAGNLISPVLFYHVDTSIGVTTGADQDQLSFAHRL